LWGAVFATKIGTGLRYFLTLLSLLIFPVVAMASPTVRPVNMPLGDGSDRFVTGAAHMVDAILEYTRWPAPRQTIQLCVAGAALHAGKLDEIVLSDGSQVIVTPWRVTGAVQQGRCDALYIGRMEAILTRKLIASSRGLAVVTIIEDDPDCRSGAMFCLKFEPAALSFQLNIDAVSRSAVRIDPRVLRMSKGGG
jgi:hypothetical protein